VWIQSRYLVVLKTRLNPGGRLRATRWALGLSLRDVHRASLKLARRLHDKKFILPPSRLHQVEMKASIPSIHRLYTLAHVYRYEMSELAHWYGIPSSS
jgi:hypothetical protein